MRAVARGIAGFLGAFSTANALVALRTGVSEDLWWIDLGGLPAWCSGVVWLAAVLLVAYAAVPVMGARRRNATAAVAVTLVVAALWNAAGFYAAWSDGAIRPGVPFPFSLAVAAVLAVVAAVVLRERGAAPVAFEHAAAAGVALVLVVAFPLAQVLFFGTTDYRRQADAAVVFGARVHDDGRLSTSLENRVRTAANLYHEGLVSRLVMSGGVGDNGHDETLAMRDRAVALGVPASAIVLDPDGVDTDATVANTDALFIADGTRRVLAVSQFYHLPRIKMAYRAVGREVWTVPAEPSTPIPGTPAFVMREVPAFWVYWARSWVRGMVGG